MGEGGGLKQPHLHVAFAHHNLSRVCELHQLVQGLRVDVMQRDVGLAALAHLICGDSGSGQSHLGKPTKPPRAHWVGWYLLVNMAWK